MTVEYLSLAGHTGAFALTPAAKRLLLEYLAHSRRALLGDADAEDTIRDIEAALAERLDSARGDGGVVDEAAIAAILAEFGPVDPSRDPDGRESRHRDPVTRSERGRRAPVLCRISQGRWFGGICLALATRSDLRVDWVRTFALLFLFLTAGLLGVVYLALVVVLPH